MRLALRLSFDRTPRIDLLERFSGSRRSLIAPLRRRGERGMSSTFLNIGQRTNRSVESSVISESVNKAQVKENDEKGSTRIRLQDGRR